MYLPIADPCKEIYPRRACIYIIWYIIWLTAWARDVRAEGRSVLCVQEWEEATRGRIGRGGCRKRFRPSHLSSPLFISFWSVSVRHIPIHSFNKPTSALIFEFFAFRVISNLKINWIVITWTAPLVFLCIHFISLYSSCSYLVWITVLRHSSRLARHSLSKLQSHTRVVTSIQIPASRESGFSSPTNSASESHSALTTRSSNYPTWIRKCVSPPQSGITSGLGVETHAPAGDPWLRTGVPAHLSLDLPTHSMDNLGGIGHFRLACGESQASGDIAYRWEVRKILFSPFSFIFCMFYIFSPFRIVRTESQK